jgi:uncharacterized DUF497 family protein
VFDFDWDDANRAHIQRHGVSVAEAEEVCASDTVYVDHYLVDDELRFEEVGQTSAGRVIRIVTTDRDGELRVVTAFDVSATGKLAYLRYIAEFR